MKLDCVLACIDDNSLHLDFVPIFIKTWQKLYPSVHIKIILVSKNIPMDFIEYKKYITLFEPIHNVSSNIILGLLKYLYPCVLHYTNGGVMVTDIDVIPLNKNFFTDSILTVKNDRFISLGESYYHIGTSTTWKDVFDIQSTQDIRHRILQLFRGNTHEYIQHKIMVWDNHTRKLSHLHDKETHFKRLSRNTFSMNNTKMKNDIRDGIYSDYQCYRPMNLYSPVNYQVYDLL